MPVFNAELWLDDAIKSILDQTMDDFELILVDNASTDRTEEICRRYADQDSRVRYFRNNKNIGAPRNYNRAVRRSKGRYFKWASGNDICHRDFLAKCVAVLDTRPEVVLVLPRTSLIINGVEDARPYADDINLSSEDPIERFTKFLDNIRLNNVTNGLVRADVLKRTPQYMPFFASDTSLMAELALYGQFVEVPENLFFRRMDAASATKYKSEEEVTRHWNPDLSPVLFSNTRAILQYFRAAVKAPIGWRARGRFLMLLLQRAIWSRQKIWQEAKDAANYRFRRER
jgi:glycosyltransferase involved in cell wall biosynthesis